MAEMRKISGPGEQAVQEFRQFAWNLAGMLVRTKFKSRGRPRRPAGKVAGGRS